MIGKPTAQAQTVVGDGWRGEQLPPNAGYTQPVPVRNNDEKRCMPKSPQPRVCAMWAADCTPRRVKRAAAARS